MESHHMTRQVTIFDVWGIYDQTWHKPHYPAYPVKTFKIASASTLVQAERLVREAAADTKGGPAHSFRVVEVPLGRISPTFDTLSEYIYDHLGNPVDRRGYPSNLGLFEGRTPEQIRFRKGDLCEVLRDDTVYLGFVAEVPPSVEEAARLNNHPFTLDVTDDSYLVMTSERPDDHDHVDALRIFKPRFKVHPAVERRLRNAYADSLTFWKRMEIADITAGERIKGFAEEQGWEIYLERPGWYGGVFRMTLRGVPGFKEGMDLQIAQDKAQKRPDRIRNTFLRLAGKPAPGRGYRLKVTDCPSGKLHYF